MRLVMPAVMLFALAANGACETLEAFSYPDTATAREHWTPQFGSGPVRVEELPDGTTCLVLEAEFDKADGRGCWDWTTSLDLSNVDRISFDISAEQGDIAGTVGIYFGTPAGWYAKFWWWGAPDQWTPRSFRLDDFGAEGEPGGWSNVTTFRFSVWSQAAGKATYRLRNLRTHERDPFENYLKNGSFETPGIGVPYAWGSGHWGVGDLPWAANMDLWRERWHLDTDAKHGDASLVIDNREGFPLLKANSVWLSTPDGSTLSAWLKSDKPALPVTLACGGKSTRVTVTDSWQQFSLNEIETVAQTTVVISPHEIGKLWIDAVQVQAVAEPSAEFHAAPADEGISRRESLVEWTFPQRTDEVAAGRTISGPLAPAEVEIDQHGRFLLDGRPYIQHSLGLEFISDLDILDFAAESGFRDVCCQIRSAITTERLTEIFDRCAQVGLRIIPWLDGGMSRERFEEHIVALRDHPALLCWYVYDEPSGDRFAEADFRYHKAKELDPDHPALINYLGDKLEDHTGDIYSTDIYPIPHSSPLAAIGGVRKMVAAAAPLKRPVWMWLQGTGYAYWMDREPSPRELSCMVYGSLIGGARGIYYFAQIPRTRECWEEMRAMCVEIDALTAPVSSLEPAPDVICEFPGIACKAFIHEGATWVLSVNTQGTAREAELSFEGASGTAEVVFEGRTVTAAEGRWRDTFGPYERHVYRFGEGK